MPTCDVFAWTDKWLFSAYYWVVQPITALDLFSLKEQ